MAYAAYLPPPENVLDLAVGRASDTISEHAANGNISAKFGLSILAGASLPALSAPNFSRNLAHFQSFGVLSEQIFV